MQYRLGESPSESIFIHSTNQFKLLDRNELLDPSAEYVKIGLSQREICLSNSRPSSDKFIVSSLYLRVLFLCALLTSSQIVYAADRVQNEIIIKLKHGIGTSKIQSKAGGKGGKFKVTQSFTRLSLHKIEIQSGQDVAAIINELSSDPDVEYVEPNYILEKLEVNEGVSVLSQQDVQQILQTSAGALGLNVTGIQTIEAWTAVSSSPNKPIVAIIDSGMDTTHEVLADALWQNDGEIAGNGIDDDHNGYVDDVHGWNFANGTANVWDGDGHGTHVAGIVRGVSQDLFAIPLAGSKIQIMPLKFLDDHGFGSTSDAINAIYYAVNNGAKILNNSWGGPSYSRALHEAIAFAYENEVLFVAAAGNAKTNNDKTPMYPASYDVPNIISVAATNDYDSLASFSNFGVSTVHVASPGVSILSSYPPNSYTYLSGTSMAAPVVAGIAALVAHEQPNMNGYQIKQVILESSDIKSTLSGKVATSARVNAFKAITSAQTATLLASQPPYNFSVSGQDRDLASYVAMGGGGCGTIEKIKGNGGGAGTVGLIILVLAAPLLVAFMLRPTGRQLRRFERYYLHSSVQFDVGDEKVNGLVGTISLGGCGIDSPVALAEGSVVKMTVCGPDGAEKIQVEGKVVWSTAQKKYGISFAHLEKNVQNVLTRWMSGLVKSA
jgi:subtilisin family serine protease